MAPLAGNSQQGSRPNLPGHVDVDAHRLCERPPGGQSAVIYRYPTAEVLGDYARSVIGLVFTLVPAAMIGPSSVSFVILAALAMLFAGLAIHTWRRHGARIRVDGDGIGVESMGTTIHWHELEDMSLTYYSTRSDRQKGWMQLVLKSNGRKLRLDSRLSGFADVVGHSRRAAIERGLALNAATRSNLEAMGLGIQAQAAYGEEISHG